MAVFNKEGLLVTKKGRYQMDDLITKLTFVSGTYLVDFLQSIGLTVPRKLRMKVLTEVLKDSVEKTIKERKSLADEMGYRLTFFDKFTDTQLVNLLEWYKSTSLGNLYLNGFWKALIDYMVVKGVGDNDIERLFQEADNALKTNKRPSTKDFNKALDGVLYDESGEIDGVTQAQFRPVTYKATTLTELRAIGDKYNAPIPKRLRKKEMLQVIFDKLKERNELTADLEKKLATKNIILLERFAKDNDIKVSTELKKEEIIEFILSNAEETKSTYFVPQSQEVYEDLDKPVEVKVVETPAPKPEPKPEPKQVVVEKVVEPQPSVIVSGSAIDYRPQLEKLSEAFNQLAQSFEKKEFVVKVENTIQTERVTAAPQTEEQPTSRPQPVAANGNLVSQDVLIQELLKDDESDVPELDPFAESTIDQAKSKKVFRYKKGLGTFAGLLALVSSAAFAWLALLAFGLLIAPFLIEANQMFADLDEMMQLVVTYGSIFLSALNLFIAFRLFMKPKKKALVTYGIITLFTGFIITGLFVFASIGSKVEKVEDEATSETARLAEAIEKMTDSKKDKKTKKSKGFGFMLLAFITFVLLVFVVLYAVWRLDFTYGYENIPFIGPFLRDMIIEPLFGSAHDMSQYYS